MTRAKYRVKMQYVETKILGRFWTWEITDLETGEIILKDSTGEDCTEEQARRAMERQLFNVRGIRFQHI